MKISLNKILIVFFLIVGSFSSIKADSFHFVGASNGDWNVASNWSDTYNGAPINVLPSDTDTVVLSKSIALNSIVDVYTLKYVGSSNISINGTGGLNIKGDLINNNSAILGGLGNVSHRFIGISDQTIYGTIYSGSTMPGCIQGINVDKPSGTLFLKDNIRFNGDLELTNGVVDAITYENILFPYRGTTNITGTWDLKNFLLGSSGSIILNILGSSSVAVNDLLRFNGSGKITLNGPGFFNVKGDFKNENVHSHYNGAGTSILEINGLGDQILEGVDDNVYYHGYLPTINIDKSNGKVYLKGRLNLRGDFILEQGEVDAITYGSILDFCYSGKIDGDIEFDHLKLGGKYTTDVTFPVGSDIRVKNKLTINKNGALNLFGPGTLRVQGDIESINSNAHYSGNGDLAIEINGSTDQNFTGQPANTAYYTGYLQDVIVNKSSGTLFLQDKLNFRGGFSVINGAVDASTYGSIVDISYSATLDGNIDFDELILGGKYLTSIDISENSVINVSGKLTINNSGALHINGPGSLNVQGDFRSVCSRINDSGLGDLVIKFNGIADQVFEGAALTTSYSKGYLQSVLIDKPSGSLILKDRVNFRGGFELLNGEMDYQTHASRMSFSFTSSLKGVLNFDELILGGKYTTNITIPKNTIVTAYNTTWINNSGALHLHGNGFLNVKGDLNIYNTSTTSGDGDLKLLLNGDGIQNIVGGLTTNKQYLQSVVINKNSGKVILSNYIGLKGDWIVEKGAVEAPIGTLLFFKGGGHKMLSGKGNVYNSVGMNSSSSGYDVTLLDDLTLNSRFILNKSILDLNGNSLIINNSDLNAIGYSPTTTCFIKDDTKSNDSYVKWNVGNQIGLYEFPFGNYTNTARTNVSVDVTTAGNSGTDGDSYIKVASYHTSSDNKPYPNNIETLLDASGQDNALNIVDRIWKIHYDGFDANPTASAVLRYGYGIATPNTLTPESVLTPQFFDGTNWTTSTNYTRNEASNFITVNDFDSQEFIIVSNGNSLVFGQRYSLDAVANISPIGFTNTPNGIIDVAVSGGVQPYSYNWSNGGATSSINGLDAGSYSVLITDSIGDTTRAEFSVDYSTFAYISDNYQLNTNNRVILHPSAIHNDELMVGSRSITLKDGGWTESSFLIDSINDTTAFYFGLDENENNVSGELMDYGVKYSDGNLYALENGKIGAFLSTYKSGEPILLKITNYKIEIYKSGQKLQVFNPKSNSALTPKAGFSHGVVFGNWVSNLFWNYIGGTEYYATLEKELDAGYYVMTNDIRFKYKEKYNDNYLDYKVYNWKRDVLINSVQPVGGHSYGLQYHSIPGVYNLLSEDDLYVMEVTNDKNETYKMRFKFETKGESAGVIAGGFGSGIPVQDCCFPVLTKESCCPTSSNPPTGLNPSLVLQSIQYSNNAIKN